MINLIRKVAPEKQSKIGPVIAFNETLLAFVIDSIFVEILEYKRKDKKSVRLNGHERQVKCMDFSKQSSRSNDLLLCSCSADHIFVWDLNEINASGKVQNCKVLARNLAYEPYQCSFHPNNKIVAMSNGENLTLFNLEASVILMEIKFRDFLHNIEFCLFNNDFILVTNQTNSLMVYNYAKQETFQVLKNELASTSFVCMSTLENRAVILTSTTDAHILVYELIDYRFELVSRVSLEKLYSEKTSLPDEVKDDTCDASLLCIGLQLFTIGANSRIEFNRARKNTDLIIACATTACLMFIELNTAQLIYLIDFKTFSATSRNIGDVSARIMPQVVEFSFADEAQINAAILLLFQNEINVVKCADIYVNKKNDEKMETVVHREEVIISVISNEKLLDNSPLNENINEKEHSLKKVPTFKDYSRSTSLIKSNSASNYKDKPLTFHSKVKSSGYTNVVKREQFTPLINKNRRSSSSTTLPKLDLDLAKPKHSTQDLTTHRAEFQFQLPTVIDKKFNASDKSNPIILMRYSDDGQNLAVTTADNLIQYLSVSNLERAGPVFSGHKDSVRSVDISHDCKHLLSTSDDKTCKLWSLKKPNDLLLDLQSVKINETKNFTFKKDVVAGSFFYLDKFILIGTENKFLLCKYYFDSSRDDIQRYLDSSFCKLVTQVNLTFSPSITALSAINTFYSYVVITGGSDKSIEVFDMNKCQSSLIINEAHARNIHQIAQNGYEHNQAPFDLFLTNALCDGVKLWDLRSAKCVNKFDNHINRCLPTKVSFSPDSFYIVAGSEDKSAFVYDVRMTGLIQKYGVFSDNVSNAQFNPKRSQLVCGTQDGKIYAYKVK